MGRRWVLGLRQRQSPPRRLMSAFAVARCCVLRGVLGPRRPRRFLPAPANRCRHSHQGRRRGRGRSGPGVFCVSRTWRRSKISTFLSADATSIPPVWKTGVSPRAQGSGRPPRPVGLCVYLHVLSGEAYPLVRPKGQQVTLWRGLGAPGSSAGTDLQSWRVEERRFPLQVRQEHAVVGLNTSQDRFYAEDGVVYQRRRTTTASSSSSSPPPRVKRVTVDGDGADGDRRAESSIYRPRPRVYRL